MSIANLTESAILNLIFRATAWANYADNASSTPETNIVIALHTADPGEQGFQNTSETAYTLYTRVNVARSNAGWNLLGSVVSPDAPGLVSPVANIDFPAGSGAPDTVTFFSTGKSGGGATAILWSGSVSPSIATGSGITPRLTTATTITLD
jgi:hypothetical protein